MDAAGAFAKRRSRPGTGAINSRRLHQTRKRPSWAFFCLVRATKIRSGVPRQDLYCLEICTTLARMARLVTRSFFGPLFCIGLLTAAPQTFADDVETSGSVLRAAIPAAAFALTFVEDDADGRQQFYRSFGANVLATLALKEVVNKSRPDGSDDDAFPSGHASMAFHGASFIHRRYGIRRAWPAYVLATYTGWTRLDADEHDRRGGHPADHGMPLSSLFFRHCKWNE